MRRSLTFYEREKIEFCLNHKFSHRKIASFIRRDRRIVDREIERNKSPFFPYRAVIAQKAAGRRARLTNKRKLEKDERLREYVEKKLMEGWSPEQIEGRLKTHLPPELKGKSVSYEAIYQYIYDEEGDGCWLYHYLRRIHPVRRKRYGRKTRKVIIPGRVSIHQRPMIVEEKGRLGDWESDTLEFRRQKQALSVQYERKAMLVRLNKLTNHTAEETQQAITKSIETLPHSLQQTMTFDNGGENAQHTELREIFGIETYFCDPYKAWQRGGVENANGLIRQYLPKKTNLHQLDEGTVHTIQERLNNRPRKSLNYQTPNEIINLQINGQLKSQSGA